MTRAIVGAVSLGVVITILAARYIFLVSASDNSVMGVSHSLACPCECPMVLEDCHMSCGLQWKNNIGDKLMAGMSKEEIMAYFFKRYGGEAMLTPAQRMAGKWYQVSRGGYPVKDMVLFTLVTLVWTALVYTFIMTGMDWIQARRKGAEQ
ncbi:MAG: cytochrome c-type biogenesis protein CcmH [Nitrospinota bacterium]|nr:cytochrome c-type biogenesis protein CcmH [Nitrospinota bacterium]